MSLQQQGKSLMKRFEKLHLGLKFGLLGLSGYLLYRKFRKEGEPIPLIDTVLPSGATKPLVASTAVPLPSDGATNVSYNGASPDQLRTAQALQKPTMEPLDPNTLAALALTTGTSELLTRQTGLEAEKSKTIAQSTGNIFSALSPIKT